MDRLRNDGELHLRHLPMDLEIYPSDQPPMTRAELAQWIAKHLDAGAPGRRTALDIPEGWIQIAQTACLLLAAWPMESEAERPERALWPSETDARRFRDVWCTGRERLESNAWNDEDAVAYWWLVKSNGSTVTVTERDEVLRGALVPGTMQNWS